VSSSVKTVADVVRMQGVHMLQRTLACAKKPIRTCTLIHVTRIYKFDWLIVQFDINSLVRLKLVVEMRSGLHFYVSTSWAGGCFFHPTPGTIRRGTVGAKAQIGMVFCGFFVGTPLSGSLRLYHIVFGSTSTAEGGNTSEGS